MSHPKRVILASASPRRSELLRSAGIDCEVMIPGILEEQRPNEAIISYILRNALEKANAVAAKVPPNEARPILSADTIVVLENRVLEKPRDAAHAASMLAALSSMTHQVATAYCIVDPTNSKPAVLNHVFTDVTFQTLTSEDIQNYLATGESFDKAGAYGIQGYGAFMIKSIHGSYTNVVGLPLCEVMESLRSFYDITVT